MPKYAVTGATGQLGRLTIDRLLALGTPAAEIVAVARDAAKAQPLAELGVQVRIADYSQPETLRPALEQVERLLLVSGSEVGRRVAQHRAVIDAAVAAGVGRIAYTSAPHADTSELILAPEHKATEEIIRASGIPYTLLRNGWYHENYLPQLPAYLAHGEIVGAAGTGRVAAAARADYADAAAQALIHDDLAGQTLELSGDTPYTMADLAATITEVTGTTVVYRNVPPEELITHLQGVGLDADTAGFVAALDVATARGDLQDADGSLARLIGRPTTPLADAVRAAVAAS